ncbi:MAG: nucleoside hydrolase [Planctomycetaceae bacterium]|nr:nucleoside hydrolase [Planctomycetaceae bacterium]
MARKVIIDCDPGIDDAVAISMALFDPRIELVAVTATAGNVPAEQASRNVQAVIERLDPPRFPRLGAATFVEGCAGTDNRLMHGDDGLGNQGHVISRLHHQHPSEKVICDVVRADPHRVTLICLGPLTNIARAFQRDPELPVLVDRLVISGGCVDGVGNVTAVAEFNMFFDASSARTVFRSPVTKTLVPLDVTRTVRLTLDFLDRLPPETTRVGGFLRSILPFTYRAYRQRLGQESILLHDVVTLVSVLEPALFEYTEMSGDVETRGELTLGLTVFDRRHSPQWRANMDVARWADPEKVIDCMVNSLSLAGSATAGE